MAATTAVQTLRSGTTSSSSSAKSTNPRRCRADQSVSLRPILKKQHFSDDSVQHGQQLPSRVRSKSPRQSLSSAMAARLGSSTRSAVSSSSGNWFDRANKNVPAHGTASFNDDSPYYMYHQNTSSSSGFNSSQRPKSPMFKGRADSENEDLRSVIDDLTIENRRLKQRLRNYRRKQPGGCDEDRLFEVRIHGLAANKRRELEEVLRSFTSGLTKDNSNAAVPSSFLNDAIRNVSEKNLDKLVSLQVPAKGSKTDSAYTSMSNTNTSAKQPPRLEPSDSAYASMTNTGGLSTSELASNTPNRREDRHARRATDRNIQSYLRDIPENLLPKQSPIIGEKKKMRIVIERLEQLFTGKRAAPGPHSQPLQQQEISQSAASADKAQALRDNRRLPPEGTREARILPNEATSGDVTTKESWDSAPRKAAARLTDASTGLQGLDQRPTRPLDLDIHRAQNADDNMQYIRHLGLSSPIVLSESDGSSRWLYLNLLISMAQLHMLNVTPEFVRKAISSFSNRLELSKDGRKLRWRGGLEGTQFSSESGSNTGSQSGNSPLETGNKQLTSKGSGKLKSNPASSTDVMSSSLQPSKSTPLESSTQTGQWSGTAPAAVNLKKASAFEYKPLFVKQSSTDSDELGDHGNGSSECLVPPDTTTMADSSLNTDSRAYLKSNTSSRKAMPDGPMIFYNHSLFYTDLSGDQKFLHETSRQHPRRKRVILGARDNSPVCCNTDREESILSTAACAPPSTSDSVSMSDLSCSDLPPLTSDENPDLPAKEFHVSGIGGVLPDDNFMLDVRVGHDHTRPPCFQSGVKTQRQVRHKVISTQRVNLLPSPLPPPSYFVGFSSSSSVNPLGQEGSISASLSAYEDESNAFSKSRDSYDDGDFDSSRAAPPMLIPQPTQMSTDSSPYNKSSSLDKDATGSMSVHSNAPSSARSLASSSSLDNDSDDDNDGAEIDLLEHARRACPEEIAAQERAFESVNLGRLNEELPAGSSAATAGGAGSGIGSPTSLLVGPEVESDLDLEGDADMDGVDEVRGSLKRGWGSMESDSGSGSGSDEDEERGGKARRVEV